MSECLDFAIQTASNRRLGAFERPKTGYSDRFLPALAPGAVSRIVSPIQREEGTCARECEVLGYLFDLQACSHLYVPKRSETPGSLL